MRRFLRYSMEKKRTIRLIFLRDGLIRQCNVRVLSLDDQSARLISTRPKEEWMQNCGDILGADYARGDEGLDEQNKISK